MSFSVMAQNINNEFKITKQLISSEKYTEAIAHINILLEKNDNANYNYLMGKCLVNQEFDKTKAIPYLLKAEKKIVKDYNNQAYNYTAAPTEAIFLLAQAYYYDYKFHKALSLVSKYKKLEGEANNSEKVTEFESKCLNAIRITNNPIKIEKRKIGDNINESSNNFSPLLNAEENILVFTSKNDSTKLNTIYISKKTDGRWSKQKSISSNINKSDKTEAVALSNDGNQILISQNDNGISNLYITRFNGEWSIPQKLNNNINSKYNETNASFTENADRIYFVSDRKGGFGGKDIYFSKMKPNGEWGQAVNLGDQINTEFNEGVVSIHSGGYTIFYSSNRPNSLGGYDLYFSDLINDTLWSDPINMGYPLNTVYNDINFYISNDAKRVYTSYKTENKDKIYKIDLLSSPKRNSVVIKGYIRNTQGEVVKNETLVLRERKSNRLIGKYTPNADGEYIFILGEGLKYFISLEDESKICIPKMISVPESASFYEIGKPIKINSITVVQ